MSESPADETDRLLAESLVSSGRLTREQLAWCRARAAAGARLAQVLVEQRVISPAEVPPAAPPERRVGPYVVLGELGRGGMGVVLRARDTRLDRVVALKLILDPDAAGPAGLERFRREAQATARLRHPGIVAIHEVGEHEGKPWLALELIAGESLEAALVRRTLAPRELAAIVRDVALALAHAHENGVIHRDVKPENVLLDASGRPHLTDFGLARDDRASAITKTGQVLGTPAYMSPEQAGGERGEHGPLSDVYSCAAVLYRGLAGRPPFVAQGSHALLKQILLDEPVPPRRLNPKVHPDLETIALRGLAKEPAARYESAAALARDLERFCQGEPILARPASAREQLGRWVRRNRALAALTLLVAVLGLGAPVGAVVSVRAARARLATAARGEARAASEAFEAARREAPASEGAAGRRERLDRVLALGLRAFQARLRAAALDPAEGEAASAVALELSRAASEAEQWSVAAWALEERAALGARREEVAAGVAAVESARTGRAREHRRLVLELLDRARSGGLRGPGAYDDTLRRILTFPEPGTVAVLASALDAVSQATREAHEGLLRSVATDDPDLDAALAAWGRGSPGAPLPPAYVRSLDAAEERVAATLAPRGTTRAARREAIAEKVLERVAAAFGTEHVPYATLLCEALGRLAAADPELALPARAPLARHLFAAVRERAAVAAAEALVRSGEPRARELAAQVRAWFFERGGGFELDSAPGLLPQAAARVDGTPDELLKAGMAALSRGDLDGAERAFERLVELRPDEATGWANRSVVRFNRKRFAEALADLDRALALRPGEPDYLSQRGLTRNELGDRAGALRDLDAAVERAPGSPIFWTNRGIVRREQGDFARAIEDLDRALELDPGIVRALVARGDAALALGDPRRAVADGERAVELFARDVNAWNLVGRARAAQKDFVGAVRAFTRSIELDPSRPNAWHNRAVAHTDARQLHEAVADYTRALELEPNRLSLRLERAEALWDLGERDRALAEYADVLEREPRNADAFLGRGFGYARAGEKDAAIRDLERFLELAPKHPRAGQVRGAIAQLRR